MKSRAWLAAWLAVLVAGCGGGGGGGMAAPQEQPPLKSDLALAASGPAGAVSAGTTTTLTITLANLSGGTATDVRVLPNLGRGLVLGAVTCTAAGAATCPADASSLAVSSLPLFGTLTFQLSVGVPEGTSADIVSAPVATAGNESTMANNIGQGVIHAFAADVSVSATGPATPVMAGGEATYRMVVTNAGPGDAHDVVIVNTLGASQTLGRVSCSTSGGATCPAPPLGATMTIPLLKRGGSVILTIPATVAANTAGTIVDAMTVTAPGDPQTANNTASAQGSAYIVAPLTATSVSLRGDAGDFVASNARYDNTQANAVISGGATGNRFTMRVKGDNEWSGVFVLPAAQAQFAPGTYANLQRYPYHDPAVGGMDVNVGSSGCMSLLGSFTVNSARYDAGQLSALDFDFEQHCGGAAPALRGHVVWVAGDPTTPPGPESPPPAVLWQPTAALPASGSYVYVEGDFGDYVTQGVTATYTNANAILSASVAGNRASVSVTGDQRWMGEFAGMSNLTELRPGYYGGVLRFPFHNPARGGLSWTGEGRGCGYSTGWFVVDGMSFSNGALAALDMRFEQHCEASTSLVHGKIHWVAGDTTVPPGPQNPPPAGLWAPPASAGLPVPSNYAYLQSDAGDYVGGGATNLYTEVNVGSSGAFVAVAIPSIRASGSFLAMNTLQRLQPGYYGILFGPDPNPTKGGLEWSMEGRGCSFVKGWFIVDRATYVGDALTALDLRFEQHCEQGVTALRGAVHWTQ